MLRRSVHLSVLLSAFLLTTLTPHAQRMLTLEEAVATALQNNYDIQLSRNDSIVAALDYSYRSIVFFPTLNGTVGASSTKNNQQLKFVKRSGGGDSAVNRDAVKTDNINYSANLNWILFDGFKMFTTRDKAKEFLALGSLTIKDQVVNTIAFVVITYYDIVRQKQQIKAIDEQIVLNEERVRLAQYKLDIGTGAKPDLLQSKVDLNAQIALKLQQETQTEQLKEQLLQAMNAANGQLFEVSDSIPINKGISLGQIQEGIEQTNPLLLIAKKNIDISKLIVKERRADRWPLISFTSAYNYNQNDNNVAVNINQPFFIQNKGFNYGLNASVPIFNRFNNKRLIQQAQIDTRYLQLVFETQRSVLNLNVITAYKEYELQKKALTLEEENILLAKENVDIVFQVYKLGGATLVQLREAQNSLELAHFRLIGARYQTKLAEIELLRLKGELVR
jgi:outer membrane protein TolC